MKKILLFVLLSSNLVAAHSHHKIAKLCFQIHKRVTFIRDSAQITTLSESDVHVLHTVNQQLQKLQHKIHKQLQRVQGD